MNWIICFDFTESCGKDVAEAGVADGMEIVQHGGDEENPGRVPHPGQPGGDEETPGHPVNVLHPGQLVNVRDSDGYTPLHRASYEDHTGNTHFIPSFIQFVQITDYKWN